ncbi:Peptidase, M23/M37 family [hydrothermal vent metagenome]|uniref:Peptidase, M23/M37 family n=1 Tax=hydrothermal vent metagenome TaxID=652676 RepID=A0A1W1E8U8_9ZZZZ
MKNIRTLLFSAIKPYSAILFLDNKIAGLLLLMISFINQSVALSGLAAVVFTILFAEFLQFKESYLAQGFYIYNSLLVGMGIGYIFAPSWISMLLIGILSAFTFMLSFMFNRLFSVYKIPILSLPFSIVTLFVYLASLQYSGLLSTLMNNATMYDISLPATLSGFLKSLGSIFFLPNNIAGAAIALIILYFSRIIFIMAVTGFYFGIALHTLLIDSYMQALHNPYAFNYILVAVALCGIFLLPTVRNFFMALIGVAISVVLTDAIVMLFNYFAIPVFTLPFNITVISFIFILSIIYYKEFNIEIKATPEASLANYLSKIFRFGEIPTKIALPFSSTWSVYQGFDGAWTHKGEYRYAYDFVKKHPNGKTYLSDGKAPQDYAAFGESVLAPVSGYIVDARSDLKDNHIGEVDHINNWGNYIIIRSDQGFYVEISHLMQHSILHETGTYVQEGTIIAKCGNSGYSPEPHIHIQVQDVPTIGGFTRQFLFSEYIINDKLFYNQIPALGEDITAVVINKHIASKFLFILDDTFAYDIYENGNNVGRILFQVKMDETGKFYLTDGEQNKLYFYNTLKEFYFYQYKGSESYLKTLFILAPRIPFISSQSVTYEDYLPANLTKTPFKRALTELAATVHKELYRQTSLYTFDGEKISSKYGEVSICKSHKGFATLTFGTTELKLALEKHL